MKKLLLFINICFLLLWSSQNAAAATAFRPPEEPLSKSVLLINMDDNSVVYEKNSDAPRAPASLVKIMVSIIVIEKIPDLENTMIHAPKEVFDDFAGVNVSNAGIKIGESIRAIDGLYALMLPSACEVANMFAYHLGDGNPQLFIDMMNAKAAELGASSTVFKNAHGLDEDGQLTTARDIYKITDYALEYDVFEKAATTLRYEMPATSYNQARYIFHTNLMMNETQGVTSSANYYDRRVAGIKTGFTPAAGRNLVSMASNSENRYMLITMGAPFEDEQGKRLLIAHNLKDSKDIYNWVFSKLRYKTIIKSVETTGQIAVKHASGKDSLLVGPEEDVITLIPSDIDVSSVQRVHDIPDVINAPVKQGQIVGTLTFKLSNEAIATVNVVAAEDIGRNLFLYAGDTILNIFTQWWFKIIAFVLLALLVLYTAMTISHNKNKRRRYRNRKNKDLKRIRP
ncbi:MAG: hypothetical protein FWH14_08520 [Oscillospiraceae bacterium]|nr:hypothetical protein [Oscillospiraceae bacterium]